MISPILAEFDRVRQTIPAPGSHLEHEPPVVREFSEGGEWATICFSHFDPAQTDAVIDREIAHFSTRVKEFEWKVFEHDDPGDLKDRLARRGFTIGVEEAFLVLDLREHSEATFTSARVASHDVRRVTSLEMLADARSVWETVFGKDFGFTARELMAELQNEESRTAAFVAYSESKPVSAGRCTFVDGSPFAGLWTGATLPEFRGQGFYGAVVAARMKEAIRRGKRYLTTDARPTSLPILLKQGFVRLSTTWPCVWTSVEQ